jgi:hypothetical protein
VQPAMGDDGLALGAALLSCTPALDTPCEPGPLPRNTSIGHTYLGPAYSANDLLRACRALSWGGLLQRRRLPQCDDDRSRTYGADCERPSSCSSRPVSLVPKRKVDDGKEEQGSASRKRSERRVFQKPSVAGLDAATDTHRKANATFRDPRVPGAHECATLGPDPRGRWNGEVLCASANADCDL